MSDEIHAILGALADRNGVTMSAYIETLILTADDLTIDPQVQDLLGVMANKAGKTRGHILELLVRQAETVLSWNPQINDRIGALAARNSMTRNGFPRSAGIKGRGSPYLGATPVEAQTLVEVLATTAVGGNFLASLKAHRGGRFHSKIE